MKIQNLLILIGYSILIPAIILAFIVDVGNWVNYLFMSSILIFLLSLILAFYQLFKKKVKNE